MQFCVYSLWNTTSQKNLNSFCGFKRIKTIFCHFLLQFCVYSLVKRTLTLSAVLNAFKRSFFTSLCSFVFIHFEIQLVKRTLTLSAVLNAWKQSFSLLTLVLCLFTLKYNLSKELKLVLRFWMHKNNRFHFLLQFCVYLLLNTTCQKNLLFLRF